VRTIDQTWITSSRAIEVICNTFCNVFIVLTVSFFKFFPRTVYTWEGQTGQWHKFFITKPKLARAFFELCAWAFALPHAVPLRTSPFALFFGLKISRSRAPSFSSLLFFVVVLSPPDYLSRWCVYITYKESKARTGKQGQDRQNRTSRNGTDRTGTSSHDRQTGRQNWTGRTAEQDC
jgi:hypothetical protein